MSKRSNLWRAMVRGWVWKCRMKNGVLFALWQPESMMVKGRSNARRELLKLANGDGDEFVYESSDITSLWEARS